MSFILCFICVLVCAGFSIIPVLGSNDLIYSAAISGVQPTSGEGMFLDETSDLPVTFSDEFSEFSGENGVFAMIQRLKGNYTVPASPLSTLTNASGSLPELNASIDALAFDLASAQFTDSGDYIPRYPAQAYAQGIFGASFSAVGTEGYPNGTALSSYTVSDSATVSGYVTRFVKKYHYVSGVDLCTLGEC